MEKIGVDGSHMDLIIDNNPLQVVGEFAYDWYSRKMIAHKFDLTENSNLVSFLLKDVQNIVSKYCVKRTIIQMDQGTSNASYAVKNIFDSSANMVLSMSEAGFKHNAPTEALNGWYKELFFHEYGNKFESFNEFEIKFSEFICKRNSLQEYVYNKKRNQLSI